MASNFQISFLNILLVTIQKYILFCEKESKTNIKKQPIKGSSTMKYL